MSTWHQDKARREGRGVPFFHETKWTVVEDGPGHHTCFNTCATEEQAQQLLDGYKKHHPELHCYKLAPGPGGRKDRPRSMPKSMQDSIKEGA